MEGAVSGRARVTRSRARVIDSFAAHAVHCDRSGNESQKKPVKQPFSNWREPTAGIELLCSASAPARDKFVDQIDNKGT